MVASPDFLRGLEDDDLYTPPIKGHSVEKIRIHNAYASIFSTAMKDKWPQRAYIGLYSGPGRARIDRSGEIVESTAVSALRLRDPFTKYIFVDHDPRCVDALRARAATVQRGLDVTVIQEDVGRATARLIDAMPDYGPGRGLLSFCFIDPFSAELDFDVIGTLGSRYRMDFLILLMLGRDIRTNFQRYLEDASDTRIARLVDDPKWRDEWLARPRRPRELLPFLHGKFDQAMTRLGYPPSPPGESHSIRVMGKNVFLYSLVFYSKDPLGQRLWKISRKAIAPQYGLEL
ncbi:MAG TPA: three-Cys-motif partner protein TcmP [Longimicrobiales bacterium]|nr:three-Cys-motif partner protein TcmP [Longimicrobiales bacterium]